MEKEKNFENRIRAFLKTLTNEWHFKHWGGGYAIVAYPEQFDELKKNLISISKGEI